MKMYGGYIASSLVKKIKRIYMCRPNKWLPPAFFFVFPRKRQNMDRAIGEIDEMAGIEIKLVSE